MKTTKNNEVKYEIYHWGGLFLSILIAYLFVKFEPSKYNSLCHEYFYWFICYQILSFFSIISLYYEIEARGKYAFTGRFGAPTGGIVLWFFIFNFISTIYYLYKLYICECFVHFYHNDFINFCLIIFGLIIFIFTFYLLIKFIIKAMNY
jgi:hypothetical protein